MKLTNHQAKYFAYELNKKCKSDSSEKFGATLMDAKVDLNPHQVEAALFAFKSPLSNGAILADEVGLGKTIEAGILLSQKWAEGSRKILIICPSSLRKQWMQELADKFYLPSEVMETKNFNKKGKLSPFLNSGILVNGEIFTAKTEVNYQGEYTVLKDVILNGEVTSEFFIEDKPLKNEKTIINKDYSEEVIRTEKQMWEYLKGPKKEKRITKDGYEYNYAEGGMIYPDSLENASRTIITGEGGKSPSRFKHIIEPELGLRRLTPIELERLNMFPDNHTKLDGITDAKRAFFMGNALVVGVIERIGEELIRRIK